MLVWVTEGFFNRANRHVQDKTNHWQTLASFHLQQKGNSLQGKFQSHMGVSKATSWKASQDNPCLSALFAPVPVGDIVILFFPTFKGLTPVFMKSDIGTGTRTLSSGGTEAVCVTGTITAAPARWRAPCSGTKVNGSICWRTAELLHRCLSVMCGWCTWIHEYILHMHLTKWNFMSLKDVNMNNLIHSFN